MKTLITLFALLFISQFSLSQSKFEDWFKNPMEMERTSEVFPVPGPLNTNPSSSVFFNINISQHSAPQNEPSVCISRKSPNRVVAAWRDFRFGSDPVANRRVGYSFSSNGGLTWSSSQLLDSTILPGLTRNSDPVVTVDTAGNFYIAVVAIPFSGGGGLTLAIYKSTNGGVTFPQAFICAQSGSEDKEWITTDLSPISPFLNHLYISWTRFSAVTGIKLTKSTNSGVNWSTPVSVSDVTSGVQGSSLCISRNGQVNVSWLGFNADAEVKFDKSTNGGASFGTDITISSGVFPDGLPNGALTFPSLDVDNSTGPRSGWLYVAFADNRNGDCDLFFSRSTNNGASWSAALRVNNDALGNGKIQYWPSIAVNEIGNIVILFMDSRNTPDNTIVEAFIARSTDGGATFTNELVSSEQSPTGIPGSNVRFGDYIDIDYVGTNIVPVWTDERTGGFNMDIYTSEINDFLPVDPVSNLIPSESVLGQNYPNPFNPTTTFSFGLPKAAFIILEIYNSLGQLVSVASKGSYTAGIHNVSWNAGSLSSGVYFYKLTTPDFSEIKKMVLVK